ncbi:MAG TPA: hypothetical protein VJ825_10020 [Gemmatimonadaceae bacterium]|nr:hypothetical protein [Gemmatimonadaceae bacterium]
MMVLSASRPDASLLEFLAQRARLSSVRRLGADLAVGVLLLVAAVRLDSWTRLAMAMAAVCAVAYAAWGLLDRVSGRISAREWPRIAGGLDAVRALLAISGVLAAIGVLLSVWALALGTWIS